MVVIGLSDIHGNTAITEKIGGVLVGADVVVLAGDITHFGHAPRARKVVEAVRRFAGCVLAVPGNCDYPDIDAWLEQEGINLHPGCSVLDGIGFAGLGGSVYTPFNTPFEYSEAEARSFLSASAAGLPENMPFVMVSHQPPANTVCDRIRGGRHVGSLALREFIELKQPMVCFTGHIHESVGTDRIGDTWIINPGPLWRGHYAYAEINGRQASVKVCSVSESLGSKGF